MFHGRENFSVLLSVVDSIRTYFEESSGYIYIHDLRGREVKAHPP